MKKILSVSSLLFLLNLVGNSNICNILSIYESTNEIKTLKLTTNEVLSTQYQGDTITLQGNISKNGAIIYSRMIIYDNKSLKTVYTGLVCFSGSNFKIEIPKGKYNIYFRYFNPGEIPVEFKDIPLQNDTTIHFDYRLDKYLK